MTFWLTKLAEQYGPPLFRSALAGSAPKRPVTSALGEVMVQSGTVREIDEAVARLEDYLKLAPGFIDALETEDDWSFIIKSHAILEAALASLIWRHLGRPELADALSFLEMGHRKYGKIALTEALGLTEKVERRFLTELGALRNLCAHRAENISFSFSSYIDSFDKQKKSNFVTSFGLLYLMENDKIQLVVPDASQVLSNPKVAILGGLKVLLATIALQSETAEQRDLRLALQAQIAEMHRGTE